MEIPQWLSSLITIYVITHFVCLVIIAGVLWEIKDILKQKGR